MFNNNLKRIYRNFNAFFHVVSRCIGFGFSDNKNRLLDKKDAMKYFTTKEFDSPDLKGSGINMDRDFLEKLDTIREKCGFAFKVNSGYRTSEHNRKVGGKPDSAHTRGFAADIKVTGSQQRFKIIQVALEEGIKRIGVARGFVHIDTDSDKPQEVIWHY